jgi:hypothetical protein
MQTEAQSMPSQFAYGWNAYSDFASGQISSQYASAKITRKNFDREIKDEESYLREKGILVRTRMEGK